MNDFFKSKLGITSIAFLSLAVGVALGGIISSGALANNDSTGSKINSDYLGLKGLLEIKDVEVTETIPFQTINEYDSGLPQGQTQVKQEGINGIRSSKFKVCLSQGRELARLLVSEAYPAQPANKVVVVGTYVAPSYAAPSNQPSQSGASGGEIPRNESWSPTERRAALGE